MGRNCWLEVGAVGKLVSGRKQAFLLFSRFRTLRDSRELDRGLAR